MKPILHWIVACLLSIAGLLPRSDARAEPEVVEKASLGEWVIVGTVDEARGEGACVVNRGNEQGVVFGFVAERASGSLFLAILGQRGGWHLDQGTEHAVTYSVDGADPVVVTARAFGEDHLSVPLGSEVARSDPLRLGRWIEFRTEVGRFRFSLAGSSRALDTVTQCAVEHLGFPAPRTADRSNVLENRPVGDWSLVAVAGESGTGAVCAVARYSEQRINLNITASRANRVLSFALDGKNAGWHLEEGAVYEVTFSVDNHPPLAAKARADSTSSILIPFATDFSQAEFLRAGRSLEISAARGAFQFSLDGSAAALDALRECARNHLGFGDAEASANPFAADSHHSVEMSKPSFEEPPLDPKLEASIASVKQLRLVRLIFEQDPMAEQEFRTRLGRVAAASAGDKKALQREAQAFLREHVKKAFQVAPADAIAMIAEADLEVMRKLEAQPRSCAVYFEGSRRGEYELLPSDLRAANSDRVADVVESAFTRPGPPSAYDEEQLVAWIAGAYVKLGYPAEDLAQLDNLTALDDGEVCRLGIHLMTAITSLSPDRAGEAYRWMKLSVLDEGR